MSTTRRVTSEDVARAAGVSRATVSYVLNDAPEGRIPLATALRVRAAADELGYRPSGAARALRRGRSDVILALLPHHSISAVQVEQTASLSAMLARDGYVFAPVCLTGDQSVDLETIRALCAALHPVAAIGAAPFTEGEREVLTEMGVAVAEAADRQGTVTGPLSTDIDREIGRAQARTLIDRGCRTLAYLRDAGSPGRRFAELRLSGFREAATGEPAMLNVDGHAAAYDAVTKEILRAGIDGVGCFDDEVAIALGSALRGKADQVRFIGVDGSRLAAAVTPAISTVAVRIDYGHAIVTEALDALLSGRAPSQPDESFAVDVIERESTLRDALRYGPDA